MRHRSKRDKVTFKRKKAAIAYYRKMRSEKGNADKQGRCNQNITPDNAAARIQYLKQRINGLLEVARACDILSIEIPQRLYDLADDKIGFKRGWLDHYFGLTYKNSGCEILYFDDDGIHFSFTEHTIHWWDEPDEISEINFDILKDFIQSFAIFESAFFKWFDELVGIQHAI